MDVPTDGRMNRQMDERMNRQMDERMNKSPPVFYRTSSPLGPLPKKANHAFEQEQQCNNRPKMPKNKESLIDRPMDRQMDRWTKRVVESHSMRLNILTNDMNGSFYPKDFRSHRVTTSLIQLSIKSI